MKGSEKMLVSIIIPVYNADKYITKCLNSILTIEDDIEIIVVNDGSKDNTKNILDEYESKYSNIRCIHQKNSGVSVSRNTGIANANGEYLAFVDADDVFDKEMYNNLTNIVKDKEIDFVYGDYITISEKDVIYDNMTMKKSIKTVKQLKKYYLSSANLNTCWGKLFKTSILKEHNIRFPKNIKIGEDRMFVGNYIEQISSFYYIDKPVYKYRIVQDGAMGSTMYTISKEKVEDFAKCLVYSEQFADRNNLSKDELRIEYSSKCVAMINIMLRAKRSFKIENKEAHRLLNSQAVKNNLKKTLKIKTQSKKKRMIYKMLSNNLGITTYVFIKHMLSKR